MHFYYLDCCNSFSAFILASHQLFFIWQQECKSDVITPLFNAFHWLPVPFKFPVLTLSWKVLYDLALFSFSNLIPTIFLSCILLQTHWPSLPSLFKSNYLYCKDTKKAQIILQAIMCPLPRSYKLIFSYTCPLKSLLNLYYLCA